MFAVDVFIHFHMCDSKDGDSNVLPQILEATFTRRKKVQTKISSFLKPTAEGEYNYSMDVVYVEGNHFDTDIFFVNETRTSFTRPLTSSLIEIKLNRCRVPLLKRSLLVGP